MARALLVATSLLLTVLSSPVDLTVEFQEQTNLPFTNFVWQTTVSEEVFPKLTLYAQYASATYCPANFKSPGDTIKCGGSCPLVEDAKAISHAEFTGSKWTDVTGYVAADPTNEVVIVAFRGSKSMKNWLTDFTFKSVPSDLCANCDVHKGFWTAWSEARPNVVPAVQNVLAMHPHYRLVVTGHSLGGAIATLAAADLRKQGHWVDLYTFGAPKVATKEGAQFLASGQKAKGNTYRVTNFNDPVPKMPPGSFNYRQTFPEYHVLNGDRPTTVKDLAYYMEPVPPPKKFDFSLDTSDHIYYFMNITKCSIEAALDAVLAPLNTTQLAEIAADPLSQAKNFQSDLKEYGMDGVMGSHDAAQRNQPPLDHMGMSSSKGLLASGQLRPSSTNGIIAAVTILPVKPSTAPDSAFAHRHKAANTDTGFLTTIKNLLPFMRKTTRY